MKQLILIALYVVAFNVIWECGAVYLLDRDPVRAVHTIVDATWAVGMVLWMYWIWSDEPQGLRRM